MKRKTHQPLSKPSYLSTLCISSPTILKLKDILNLLVITHPFENEGGMMMMMKMMIMMLISLIMRDFGEHKMRKMKVSFKLHNTLQI